MATRTRKAPRTKHGAQGIQFITGWSIMAVVGSTGSYRTTTEVCRLPVEGDPSQFLK